jgi:parallel beta-helix repeat protein
MTTLIPKINFKNGGATPAGAVSRDINLKMEELVSVKDFGALGNGSTNDTAAIQAAINGSVGKSLFFPAGTYKVSNLTISTEINFIGEGYTLSQLSQIAGSTGAVVTISATRHPSMRHLSIAGTSTGGDCVAITGASSGNQFFDCFFTLAGRDGLNVSGTTDNTIVLDCIFEVNGRHGIFFDSGTTAGLVTNSRIVSNVGNGVVASGNVLNPGVKITENVFGGNVIGIQLINQYFNIVSDNTILLASSHGIELNGASYNNITGNIVNNNTGDGIHITEDVVISTYNNITDNNIRLNANGIYFDGTGGGYNNVANNVVINSLAVGIGIVGSGNNTILGNQVLGNGLTATPKYGIYLSDGGSGAASNNRIVGNSITNLGNGALQTTGIYNGSAASNTIITNNNIVSTTPVNIAGGSVQLAAGNQGYITEAVGTSQIASGATSVVISHGLSITPNASAFTIMLTGLATNDPGEIYITNITSTQFTVNCRNNPGASTLPFYWKASAF